MLVTYYDVLTGRIVGSASTSAEDAIANRPAGTEIIAGMYDGLKFYVLNGTPTALPTKPSDYFVFDYVIKQWVDVRTVDTQWVVVRAERNHRLQVTDWTQLPDVAMETKQAWANYRQALRDITKQSDPFNIIWPAPLQH